MRTALKIRVVFDCSTEYQGRSLNNELMSGPDLTNQITGVLIRFRQEPIAIMADIESMFYQVRVPEKHQNVLRFLWWENNNLDCEPSDHQMCVHVFGGTSSPSCSNFALKQTSTDNVEEFGSAAVQTIQRNFYVDEMLKSVENKEVAIKLVNNVIGMCQKGEFKLTKFIINNKEVLTTIPEE